VIVKSATPFPPSQEYILIARPSAGAGEIFGSAFEARFREAIGVARKAYPEIEWQGDFVLGPKDCVEMFAAADARTAARVSALVRSFGDFQAQVVPLTRQ
jgi:hypothetical protein